MVVRFVDTLLTDAHDIAGRRELVATYWHAHEGLLLFLNSDHVCGLSKTALIN